MPTLRQRIEQAQYAVACDKEACDLYQFNSSWRWRIRCWLRGFLTTPF